MAWPAKEEEEGGERKLKTVSRDLHKYLEHHAAHALETFNERSPKIGQRVKVYWDGEGCRFQGTVTERDQQGRVKVCYDDSDERWEDD